MSRSDDDRHDDDDYDDRPRRRRRPRDDDDDYDDRPRRRKPEKSRNIALPLVIGLVVLIGCCGLGAIGLLLPAVSKVRQAAARAQETNNLKQIGIAMHSYNDVNRRLPSADDKVSWRVHVLPYMEQQALYQQFDTKQAWDSAKNRIASDMIVSTYLSPADPAPSTGTHYRVFTGPGTVFEPKEPRKIHEITDGTSNTILAVEATETVPWAQPKELPFTPNGGLPPLGHPSRDVVLILLSDASVRSEEKQRLDPTLLRALITPAGKEQLPADW